MRSSKRRSRLETSSGRARCARRKDDTCELCTAQLRAGGDSGLDHEACDAYAVTLRVIGDLPHRHEGSAVVHVGVLDVPDLRLDAVFVARDPARSQRDGEVDER